MRQAPVTYAIIGNGRLARHFCHYFDLLHIPYSHWHRGFNTSPQHTLKNTSHILLAISDSQIELFIQENLTDCKNKQIVHFSGSHLSIYAHAAHPLMTFGDELYPSDTYEKMPLILEAEGPTFHQLLPGLNNPHFFIPRQQKAYYHALCVMANNFTTLLWQKFFTALEINFAIPADKGKPFLHQTMHNLNQHFRSALTGPLVRNDEKTISEHLAALAEDDFKPIYQSFVDMYQQKYLIKKERGKHPNECT